MPQKNTDVAHGLQPWSEAAISPALLPYLVGRWPRGRNSWPVQKHTDHIQLWKTTTTLILILLTARRANAWTIHICNTRLLHKQSIFAIHDYFTNNPYLQYRTPSQTSPSHNQSSQTFELLHATSQQNDCTSSSFPVNLWPWVNIKTI